MRHRTVLLTLISLLLYAGLVSPPSVLASENEVHDEEQARKALENGEIVPLDCVVDRLKKDAPGEVSRIELEKEDGIWIYEFKIISPDGHMLHVRVNAQTCQLLSKDGD